MNTYVITACCYDDWENIFERYVDKVLVNVDKDSLKEYQCYGYEIYIIDADGEPHIIQNYDDYPDPEDPYADEDED